MLQLAKQFAQKYLPAPVQRPYRTLSSRVRRPLHRLGLGLDSFLADVESVVHVGAHIGQERDDYDYHDLEVLWVEPNPEVFARLQENIKAYPKQRAVAALVTDRAGVMETLNIASNAAAASSILALKEHKRIWPHVDYSGMIEIESSILPDLLDRPYDALVLDTQGAELLILKGCGDLVRQFRYIKTETADFELYDGYPQLSETTAFLARFGFREQRRKIMKTEPGIGTAYEIVFASDKAGAGA